MKYIQKNKAIQKLSSAFIIASLIMGISIHGFDDQAHANTILASGALESKNYEIINEEDIFHTPKSLSYRDISDFTLINNNSIIAPKVPPNKKQVVTSRMWIFVTAYSSTPDQTDDTPFITASGNHVRDGIIAANFLPMYTKVRFPTLYGEKVFVVEDRMNKRYYYRADIWMRTRDNAKQFGIKNVPVEIIRQL